jgi:hypothetical protein
VDRSNSQASFGLKVTCKEDLEEGVAIFGALYDPFNSFRMAS